VSGGRREGRRTGTASTGSKGANSVPFFTEAPYAAGTAQGRQSASTPQRRGSRHGHRMHVVALASAAIHGPRKGVLPGAAEARCGGSIGQHRLLKARKVNRSCQQIRKVLQYVDDRNR
jgi:hypothetical protein